MVLDIGRATAKWSANAARAGPDYRAGVAGKGNAWLSNSVAAEPLWASRIQEAIASGSRQAGISRVGAAGWEQAATSKGATNFTSGVQNPLSSQKYSQNFGPILQVIASARAGLPPRGAPMSAENLARAQYMWEAVHRAAGGRTPGHMEMVNIPAYTPPHQPAYTPPGNTQYPRY